MPLLLDEPRLVAFRHPEPETPVHVVVASRQHFASLAEVGEEHAALLGELVLAARRIAEKEGILGSGFRIVMNHGADAEQNVPHLHLHVFGGRALHWPPA